MYAFGAHGGLTTSGLANPVHMLNLGFIRTLLSLSMRSLLAVMLKKAFEFNCFLFYFVKTHLKKMLIAVSIYSYFLIVFYKKAFLQRKECSNLPMFFLLQNLLKLKNTWKKSMDRNIYIVSWSPNHLYTQTVRARELTFLENVYPWHVTPDTWHVICGGVWTFSQNLSSLTLTVRV